jgi:hypothetical protein
MSWERGRASVESLLRDGDLDQVEASQAVADRLTTPSTRR